MEAYDMYHVLEHVLGKVARLAGIDYEPRYWATSSFLKEYRDSRAFTHICDMLERRYGSLDLDRVHAVFVAKVESREVAIVFLKREITSVLDIDVVDVTPE